MVPILAILLATVTTIGNTGNVYVRTEPGIIVFLDGQRFGVTNVEESGLMLNAIPTGTHELRFQMGTGMSAQRVNVTKGDTTTVMVSSLALRTAARKGALEIKITPATPDCTATIADKEVSVIDSVAGLYDLSAGTYDVTVTCGAKVLKGKAAVTSGRTTDVQANLTTKVIKTTGDHERVAQQVNVPQTRDRVANSPLSAEAKRALLASLPSGVEVLSVQVVNSAYVHTEFEAPDLDSASQLMMNLKSSGEFKAIAVSTTTGRVPRQGHVVFALDMILAYW